MKKVKERIPDGQGGFEVIYEDYESLWVLGTEYAIYMKERREDKKLSDMDGYCNDSSKDIVIAIIEPDTDSKSDLKRVYEKVLRHEIVHAFLCESGLAENSDWAQNEELVDWIAIQGPKIWKAWQEAGAV